MDFRYPQAPTRSRDGTVALTSTVPCERPAVVGSCSDGSREFGERGRDALMRSDFAAEFVVTASHILHERVPAHDHACSLVAFEPAHWSEPRFESAMVGFDPIVRILLGVVERVRHE